MGIAVEDWDGRFWLGILFGKSSANSLLCFRGSVRKGIVSLQPHETVKWHCAHGACRVSCSWPGNESIGKSGRNRAVGRNKFLCVEACPLEPSLYTDLTHCIQQLSVFKVHFAYAPCQEFRLNTARI